MKFFCDLHVHSRFSRATSASLTVAELGRGAVRKGIAVVGTGDLTHPAWMKEIEEELTESEPGLYRLKNHPEQTRFILTGEISTIYKHAGKVRKVHHVVCAPDIMTAKRIGTSLAKVGNILSDGRPILGITSRNLLEIVLEAGEGAFLIPAHIWTPWFSALGSKSGYDSIQDCYLDLEPNIFAVETGLSSDPLMNWMVSSLDRYSLVSCSDAHSAEKLGREATVFDCALDYHAIRSALATGEGLLGTVEFFPEEGKYHLDGHRDCGVVVTPEETKEYGGLCPRCGKPLTIGVLNRVEELSDRHEGDRPPTAKPYSSLIPLAEILSEIMQVSAPTKKVVAHCEMLASRLGGELPLLLETDPAEIGAVGGETLALAVSRMRSGDVHKEAGYDGRFGRVRVFRDNERDMLFAKGLKDAPVRKKRGPVRKKESRDVPEQSSIHLGGEQLSVVNWDEGALAVVAGPGTGKTRVLVERARRLAGQGQTPVLAITFTSRAALEIQERLGRAGHETGGGKSADVEVSTFHSLAARIMREAGLRFDIADEAMLEKVAGPSLDGDVRRWVDDLMLRQSTCRPLEKDQEGLVAILRSRGYLTYEGLVEEATRLVVSGERTVCWRHVMADEFQDINPVQYTFLKALSQGARSVMVIGDPNQAIYAFRGSSPASFDDFMRDNPSCARRHLSLTHRLSSQIAGAAGAITSSDVLVSHKDASPIMIARTDSPYDFIASEIDSLAGGMSHSSVARAKGEYALSDMAVIVRTRGLARGVMDALAHAGIPCDAAYARPMAELPGIRERVELLTNKSWEHSLKGVGQASLERVHAGGPLPESLEEKIHRASMLLEGLEGDVTSRIRQIEESGLFKLPALEPDHPFHQFAVMFGDRLGEFIEFLRLSHDQGALGGEKVHVLTAHAAKGLEFRCVFMAGLSGGVFPLEGSSPEEERNLFYVAMTRAGELLYLVCPLRDPSGFVAQIPAGCAREVASAARKAKPGQMVLFD